MSTVVYCCIDCYSPFVMCNVCVTADYTHDCTVTLSVTTLTYKIVHSSEEIELLVIVLVLIASEFDFLFVTNAVNGQTV